MEDLTAEKKSAMDEIVSDPDILMLEMSTFTEDGVMTVKQEVRIEYWSFDHNADVGMLVIF